MKGSGRDTGQSSTEINCLITHQPDKFHTNSVSLADERKIDREKLLRYLVFRHHNEFHEQCVERTMTFCASASRKLSVYARYTRRGGTDINPWRTNIPISSGNRSSGASVIFFSICVSDSAHKVVKGHKRGRGYCNHRGMTCCVHKEFT